MEYKTGLDLTNTKADIRCFLKKAVFFLNGRLMSRVAIEDCTFEEKDVKDYRMYGDGIYDYVILDETRKVEEILFYLNNKYKGITIITLKEG